MEHYLPKDKQANDTLVIHSDKSQILIDLTFYQLDLLSYLLRSGDTLEVQYKQGMPICRLINRTHPEYEFKYDSLRRQQLKIKYAETQELFNLPKNTTAISKFLKDEQAKVVQTAVLLDSLVGLKLMSPEYHTILREKNKYSYLNTVTSFYVTNNFKNIFDHSINEKNLSQTELLDFSFYYVFLNNYAYSILNANNGFKSSNGFRNNSMSAFDSIIKDPLLTNKKIKDVLMKRALTKIYDDFSKEDFDKYYDKFKTHVTDTLLISEIEGSLLINFDDIKKDSEKTYLIDIDKRKVLLPELLTGYKGKIVYVDFWASWCAPCLKAMPASKEIRKQYKDKDIVFLYISIDHDYSKWQDASIRENIPFKSNFLAINYPASDFYKKLNLKSIPRYILFNKNGELVHQNAPGPDTEEIRGLLDEHLKE